MRVAPENAVLLCRGKNSACNSHRHLGRTGKGLGAVLTYTPIRVHTLTELFGCLSCFLGVYIMLLQAMLFRWVLSIFGHCLLPSHFVVWLRFPLLPLSSQQAQLLWFCSSLTRWMKSCSGAALNILNGYSCPAMPEISLCMSCPVHKGKFVHGKPPSCRYQS